MKKLLLPFALLVATVLQAQPVGNPEAFPDPAKTYQEVYSTHQSLAQAYLREADPRDLDVFYGENFRSSAGKIGRATRQQMDAKMKTLVAEGMITQGCTGQADLQLSASDPATVVVSGTWRAPAGTPPGKGAPYTFIYSRQDGVWKLTEARFLTSGQKLAARRQ
jgi:hypothetical protein